MIAVTTPFTRIADTIYGGEGSAGTFSSKRIMAWPIRADGTAIPYNLDYTIPSTFMSDVFFVLRDYFGYLAIDEQHFNAFFDSALNHLHKLTNIDAWRIESHVNYHENNVRGIQFTIDNQRKLDPYISMRAVVGNHRDWFYYSSEDTAKRHPIIRIQDVRKIKLT